MSIAKLTHISQNQVDSATNANITVSYYHHEQHSGSAFFVCYSVADLGAMTTPNDTITLTFKTPDSEKWGHFTFNVGGASGARVRLIEAPTGGAASPTGTFDILNHNRNSANLSTFTDISNAVSKVSYDATLATGGTTLIDKYILGSSTGLSDFGIVGLRSEMILKQNTTYQVSIFSTATEPAFLQIDWYEHTNRGE